jgi:integrase
MNLKHKAVLARLLREAPEKDDEIIFDDEIRGFGLRRRRLSDRVARTWIVQYRANAKTRRINIGDAGVVGQGAARERAKKLLAQVHLGGDPQGEKKAKRLAQVHTLHSVAAEYLAFKEKEVAAGKFRPNSLKVAKLYLTGPYFRSLHASPAAELSSSDLALRLKWIEREHSAASADAARTHLNGLYTWAMRGGLLGENPRNPVINTHAPPIGKPRERVLTDGELAQIWKACSDDELGDFRKIVRLLILTGQRRSEIGGIRRSEIDYEKRSLTLPAERVKNGHAHTIPLTDAALDILRSVVPYVTRETLFGGPRRRDGYGEWSAGKQQLDARVKIPDWSLHDLRRTFATGMADIGIAPHVIEEILNHRSGHKGGISGIYNKSRYTNETRAAMERWAEHVGRLVEQKSYLGIARIR